MFRAINILVDIHADRDLHADLSLTVLIDKPEFARAKSKTSLFIIALTDDLDRSAL